MKIAMAQLVMLCHNNQFNPHKPPNMNNLFKGLIAGYGAYKLGGGCLGTILVFVVIFMLLGQCS